MTRWKIGKKNMYSEICHTFEIFIFYLKARNLRQKNSELINYSITHVYCFFWYYPTERKLVHGVKSFSKSSLNFDRSRSPEVFCKKDVLKNFAKLTGKNPFQSLSFSKKRGFIKKRGSGKGVFLQILRNF